MRRFTTTCATLAVLTAGAWAQSATELAMQLGEVIGSEAGCGLAYNQAAIAAYIEAKVPPDDMGFTGLMNATANITAGRFDAMTDSQKTAHCTQVRRVAMANGFVN